MKRSIFLSVLLLAILAGCGHSDHEEHKESVYVVSHPILRDTTIYQEYVSQIRSIQHIELRAIEKGYLQHVYVDEGQTVKKGDLLFQILPVVYRAETQKAEAELNFAEIEYANTKALADSNIVSKNELALAKAKLAKAQSELNLAKTHLSFTEIHAPFDGIIGRFNDVRLGSLLDEGELLTTLSDNSKMWVYFNVPEAEYLNYASRPKPDSLMHVKLELANGDVFSRDGVVETIEADFKNETGNIAFRATFDNPDGLLRNGETGNIMMPVVLHQALLIPQKATFEILDKKYVYVVLGDSIQAREIKVGTDMAHIYVVTAGLTEGDQLLMDGLRKVKSGQKIKYEVVGLPKILADLHKLHAE